MFKVRISATVVNPDTEDNFNGWVDPDYNMTTLFQDKPVPKFFDSYEDAMEYIHKTIGETEHFEKRGSRIDHYSEGSVQDVESGEYWSYVAHVEDTTPPANAAGFTTWRGKELSEVGTTGPLKIKVLGSDSESKWLSITDTELEKIIAVLEPEDYRKATQGTTRVELPEL